MKILAFSDLHRDRAIAQRIVAASADADVLVGAGDFAMRGIGLSDTLDILKGVRAPLIVVSGNHDNSKELREACEAAPMLRYLDGDGATFGGVTFFGIGREIPFQKNAPWSESYSEQQADEALQACPEGAVLVSHAPPFGIVDHQTDGRHDGSQALLGALTQKKPMLHLCGHIHHCAGQSAVLNQTRIFNLGPSLTFVEI
ncbi:metallophosphoesterase family protein [Sulfitobacter pseudonitzschiae]|uniref:Metallophosphoesterase family protein n=1 Tax=Pseudosulfitobacter pseudonitzschiae TaxID=1402135 RepID=A0A9Q2S0M2_9RHOB|nr:metallophosphoesterase family protein [Pseudosulfitobacter pseudonitzschiae]MBM2293093.1 metallophosphoesterase family protein [Pseudosulfitobacter pseudonitzschiae]MBM2297619.1 metallophosphoesterase family protein [Pseudosulfitobacter pseudonitzschiae]MBM2302533.1 metallophosphoesterase family protein [Pseudosulfitobacter pseudonitzschiae]MBM2312477.1 metallophosphoesterase family protein [Pseudosulfitobacter pseudonitzschiae]MBM2317229.1 metallophosphoesterase family protein [Pseudosulfi